MAATLTGPSPNILYHGRLAAASSAGIGYRSDVTRQTVSTDTRDFNGEGKTDILWRHKISGGLSVWFMKGDSPTGAASPPGVSDNSWEIVGLH